MFHALSELPSGQISRAARLYVRRWCDDLSAVILHLRLKTLSLSPALETDFEQGSHNGYPPGSLKASSAVIVALGQVTVMESCGDNHSGP